MKLSTAKTSVEILNKFTDMIKSNNQNKNTVTYINIFTKVVNYFYCLYEASVYQMEQKEAIKLLSEIEEILRINIEIIETTDDSKEISKYISQLRAKRNKIMSTYIKMLKEA
ncbi:BlyB family putative holin accessory protein [Borrelia coriaceae]|uniref:BlyB family putative holin accessory protein n=1 Tax=Borrelia coriaceae TaxID=144 RepID=UPI0004804D88|nr:BlyB family putative holin accessory protein [Borrelia coriaceae]